jgi:hypothetical protein
MKIKTNVKAGKAGSSQTQYMVVKMHEVFIS